MRLSYSLAILLATGTAALAQAPPAQPNGSAVFERACASCHQPGQTAVPAPAILRSLTPEAIVNSLVNGKMSVQGAGLTAAERSAIAQFLTGRAPVVAAATGRPANQCTAATPTADPARGPAWTSWGNDAANSRFAPKSGLTAADLPRLKLKWAFGYEGATSAR
jgi:polyvinyl alcohol dehydrogenase (cytochrome)